MKQSGQEIAVSRSHGVQERLAVVSPKVRQTRASRSLEFLSATVKSTERLGTLASDALFPDQVALLPIEDFDPIMADFARSMILFAGAGIDATLKQLLRDCLAACVDASSESRREFETHVERTLKRGDDRAIARFLVAKDARRALLDDYLASLTSTSLQSYREVAKITSALGVTVTTISREPLETLFVARNIIAHELDLLDPDVHGMTRRKRLAQEAWTIADEAYAVVLTLIEAVSNLLGEQEADPRGQLNSAGCPMPPTDRRLL